MGSGPRHEKAEMVLKLALMMQATRAGLSLEDVQHEMGVSRRTAERLRDAVERVFPQMELVESEERTKRWRLPSGVLSRLTDCSSEQLAAMNTAISLLTREGAIGLAGELERLQVSLRGAMRPEHLRRVEPDLEVLTLAEGLAMRPGARLVLNTAIVSALRKAILGVQAVRIQYKGRESGKDSWQTVHPYGFLYGRKAYLVSYSPTAKDWRLLLLANISKAEETGEPYLRDPAFSLQSYAERSFGVFQEEPLDIVLKFSSGTADDVRQFYFHPTQIIEEQKDGSLIVRFRAGGLTEVCWHLFTWGNVVEILEPIILREKMRRMCEESLSTIQN